MSELQRLKSLLPPENESWVFVEAAAAIDPPLITLEEIGRDEVEIQIDLDEWDNYAIDHRNLLFWHEVGKIQNDTIPRDGWEMAALAIGLGGAIGELWVQDGLLLLLSLIHISEPNGKCRHFPAIPWNCIILDFAHFMPKQ